jgi:hypothetical protein
MLAAPAVEGSRWTQGRVGVRVISVTEPWMDTSGPVRTLLIAIFSWVGGSA